MSASPHRTEIYVGLFVVLGAALVGGLILRFSSPHLAALGGYPIIVEVKDATGIRAGVPVRLGGVDIGRVAVDPVLNADFVLLSLSLEIFPGNRIPAGSTVKVGTNGLMGDSFVRIIPPERPTGEFLPEGHRIVAESASSLNDLAGEAGEAFDGMTEASAEIRVAADRIERLSETLEHKLLTDENLANLGVILAEMKSTSQNLNTASGRIGPLLDETSAAIGQVGGAAGVAKATFAGVDKAAAELSGTLSAAQPVLTDLDKTLDNLRATLASSDKLIKEFENGNGLATALLKDTAMKKDWTEFLDKVNRAGLLFYPREGGAARSENLPGIGDPSRGTGEEKPIFPGLRRQP